MTSDVQIVWTALRGAVREGCSFAMLKEIAGAAGLPVQELSHLEQKRLPASGASKPQLLDAIDRLIQASSNPEKSMLKFVSEFLAARPHLQDEVEERVQEFGWTVADGKLHPSDFQVDEAIADLPHEVKQPLQLAYIRFQQGDFSGAMTSICGAVDALTTRIYRENDALGNPLDASYQERVNRSYQAFATKYEAGLIDAGFSEEEAKKAWNNHSKSVNGAAYVLGSFRRTASDAHGNSESAPQVVRHAIDCGTFIIRSITAVID